MFSLFLNTVLCEPTAEVPVDTGSPMNIAFVIALCIDLLFVLYVVFSSDERVKKFSRFLLLVHGSAAALLFGSNIFGDYAKYSIIAIILVLAVLYYFMQENELFVKIICTANVALMFGTIVHALVEGLDTRYLYTIGSLVVIGIGAALLAFTKFEMLYKLHTVFVAYLIIMILIKLTPAAPYVSKPKDIINISISLIVSAVVFGTLTYFVFFD